MIIIIIMIINTESLKTEESNGESYLIGRKGDLNCPEILILRTRVDFLSLWKGVGLQKREEDSFTFSIYFFFRCLSETQKFRNIF